MNNMSKIIMGHNKKVTSKPHDQNAKMQLQEKAKCPMEGNCEVNDVVYKCDVTKPLPKKSVSWASRGRMKELLL